MKIVLDMRNKNKMWTELWSATSPLC